MAKFCNKPIVIEAEQWFPPGDSQHVPGRFTILPAPRGQREQGQIYKIGPSGYYDIETLEGGLHLSPGDWIITGVKGERYPCRNDIFRMTYDPAGE